MVDAGGDDAEDVARDAPTEDSDADALDAEPDGDVDAEPDGADADPDTVEEDGDGGGSPYAHCEGRGEPGAGVSVEGPGAVRVACGATALRVRVHDGAVRLSYVPDGVEGVERGWGVPALPPPSEVVLGAVGGDLEVCSATSAVRVTADCRVQVRDAAGEVVLDDGAGGGFVAGQGGGGRVTREAPAGERYVGFGEKTGPLQKRGQRMTFWNTDAYDPAHGGYAPGADPLYLSIPFFIGLREGRAHGVFTDNTWRTTMDMAATDSGQWSVEVEGGVLDQWVLLGPSVPEVVERYTALTGRMAMPPLWALGYHQCRWGYGPESRVREVASRFRSLSIPADVLWLDIQHMDGFRTFTFDPVGFPDPERLMADLASDGFSVVVIADPGIKAEPGWDVYDSGVAADIFLKTRDDALYVGRVWPGDAVFPDFSDPDARAWWAARVGGLVGRGVDGIWLDVNEPTNFPEGGQGLSVPNDVPAHGDGQATTMAEVHNVYGLLEATATREGLRAAAPDRRPFIVSRAGYAGIQRVAAVWTGDVPSTWHALAETLPMMLNVGLSGVPMVGSDVGGYSGGATPELYARWMALGVLSPFFRTHTTNGVNDQEPWAFGLEVEAISRAFIELRYRLLPYLYSLAAESARTGAPMLRPLLYHFQTDSVAADVQDEAMLGPWVLAAPVLEEGAVVRRVQLPEGRWMELNSGALHQGPGMFETNVTLGALPLYLREGAILPRGPFASSTKTLQTDVLDLDVVPAAEPSTFTRYVDAGDGYGPSATVTYALQQTGAGMRLGVSEASGAWALGHATRVRVRRVDLAVQGVQLDGSALSRFDSLEALDAAPRGWFHDVADRALVIRVDRAAGFELTATYDPTVTELIPLVPVTFEVEVPPGTPTDTPLHIASDANGWTHQPLAWVGPTTARGTLEVPAGRWFFYKFTRGGWETVEKWPDCAEADNRYGQAAAHPLRRERVFGWRDWCPP